MAEANFPEMTPKAAEAFALYVGMGHRRSLRGLAEYLVTQKYYKTASTAFTILRDWSVKYDWQARLASAVTALTESRLELAAEIDAASFLKTSERIAERLDWTMPEHIDTVLKIRESVRKPSTKTPSLQINFTLIVKQMAEKYGLTEDESRELDEELREHFAATKVNT